MEGFFSQALVLLAATLLLLPLFQRLGLGSILGYLAAGIAVGPLGLALVSGGTDVLHFAELGVVLMLFLVGLELAEVRDIDEDAFREGVVRARHYGELQVPAEARYLQQVKCGGREVEDLVVTEVAAWIADSLEDDTFYLMGSGSTVAVVMEQLGLENTLLGVDLVYNQEVVGRDLGARALLEQIGDAPARAVITVIGGQGHLFGRGNQQFSPALIRRLGKDNIQILATRTKLKTLEGRPLLVDTGDAALDRELCGLWPVTTGYEDQVLYRVSTEAVNSE